MDKVKLLADLSELERRMRLAELSDDKADTSSEDIEKYKEEECFHHQGETRVETFTLSWWRMIIANLKKSEKLNVSKEENTAFYELLQNK